MITFWRFLFGFLTVAFYGDCAEQILNIAAKNSIKVWNLRFKKGYIIGNISIKNFIKLRHLKRGIKCKIKIIKKNGLIFRFKKYGRRTGVFIGIILFFAILFIMSNFVWIINVEGNVNISRQEILNSCRDIGIYVGMPKNEINTKYDAQKFLLQQKGLAWGSLNLEGCVLTVNLSEAKFSDKEKRETPSNLKATFDGKISKIDVKSGNVLVRVGDTVSRGDLLVSGIVENMGSTLFVYSEGTVTAKTRRTYSAEGKYKQIKTLENGKVITRNTIDFFGLRIPLYLGSVKAESTYTKEVKNLKLFGKEIPIKIACEKYSLTHKETVNYDKETLEEMLYEDVKKQVEESGLISSEEVDREVTYTENGILLKITYNCEENIAVQDKILLDTEN